MFGKPSDQPFGSRNAAGSGDCNMDSEANSGLKPVFGTLTTSASVGFVFGMPSTSMINQQPSLTRSTSAVTPIFGGSSSTASTMSFSRPLFGNIHQSSFSKPPDLATVSSFAIKDNNAKNAMFTMPHNKNSPIQEGPIKQVFGKEIQQTPNIFKQAFSSLANTSADEPFRFGNTPQVFGDLQPNVTQTANFVSSDESALKKPQTSLFGGAGDATKHASSSTNLFSSKPVPSIPFIFGKPFGSNPTPNTQNLFALPQSSVSVPSASVSSGIPPNTSQENVFKKPLEKNFPKNKNFLPSSSHSSNVFSKLGSESTRHKVHEEQSKGFRKTSETKGAPTIPSKQELDSSTKRHIIQRPTLTGNLFGQALAGIKKSSKEIVRRRRVSEEETEARSRGHEVRLIPTEELSNVKSIVCKGIPESLNENLTLRKMFAEFGSVHRVFCNPMKQLAIIHFLTHDSAARAKQNGAKLFPNTENVAIFWSQSISALKKKSPETKANVEARKSPHPPEKSKFKFSNDEVEEELRSMTKGTEDFALQPVIERPPEVIEQQTKRNRMCVDKSPTRQKKKKDNEADSLIGILQKQALTAGEKFLVLDARDKILRQNKKKQSNLATAEIFVGTCQDMCPEKEQYLREDKGQLHPYEIEYQTNKTGDEPRVNRKTVIKEYSRSSADQEEPLPHELRPASVLKMTMDHLICNVMDRLDHSDNPAEWYDFVWNRTRSIRKDITQQHLCDIVAVELVEKCARFHIHCAERLCEEDMRNFDQKINNENLTKCLQTLKHFYHDLGLKNIVCSNEPEFRGYDVLLNLNEGNILWQVQQLKSEVQSSSEVRFALQAFAALNSNNYVRFFKLVEKATYLNACIMHRYFIQVRSKALQTLTRACCPVSHTTSYPLKEINQLLGFQDEKEAEEFCAAHSLVVKGENIILDRNNITLLEATLPLHRSKNLIENKRTILVGEVVNGGALSTNPSLTYEPTSSFTQDGYLKSEILKALIDEKKLEKHHTAKMNKHLKEETTNSANEEIIQTLLKDKQFIKDLTRDVILEELNDIIRGICVEFINNASLILQGAEEVSLLCLQESTDAFMKDLVFEVIEETMQDEFREQQKKLAKEQKEEMETRIVSSLFSSICEDIITTESEQVAVEEIKNIETLKMENFLNEFSPIMTNEILHQVVSDECFAIADNTFVEVIEKRRKLSEIAQRLWRLRILQYFERWKNMVAIRQKSRKDALEFPSIPGAKLHQSSANMSNSEILPKFILPMDRLSQQLNLCHLFDVGITYRLIDEQLKTLPLDLKMAAQPILNKQDSSLQLTEYWKIIVSLPQLHSSKKEDKEAGLVCKWIRQKLSRSFRNKPTHDEGKIQLWSCYSMDVSCSSYRPNRKISFCIKGVHGLINQAEMIKLQKNQDFLGSHGILFLLPSVLTTENKPLFWEENFKRLNRILQLTAYVPALPIVILLCGWTSEEFDKQYGHQHLHLMELISQNLLSAYFIYHLPDNILAPSSSLQLMKSLNMLAAKKPLLPDIMRQPLPDFLEDSFLQWFSVPAFQNLAERKRLNLTHQDPEILINLYNTAVERAIQVATSSSLKKISWPVVEFTDCHPDLPSKEWNSKSHFDYLSASLRKLKLPSFSQFTSDDSKLLWDGIKAYVSNLPIKADNKTYLGCKIHKLVNDSFKSQHFKQRGINSSPVQAIPWTDIIHLIAECIISTLINSTSLQAASVYYLAEEFRESAFSEEWRKASRVYDKALSVRNKSNEQSAVKRKQTDSTVIETKRQAMLPPSPQAKFKLEDFQLNCLLQKIQSEKEQSRQFEDRLLKCLNEDTYLYADIEDEDTKTPDNTNLLSLSLESTPTLTLDEQLLQLQASIESQKEQDKIFERRLQFICDFSNLNTSRFNN